jgi:uncharacterized protein (DUF736 family)
VSGYQQKDGTGSLFKNDKGDNPKRPDYRGSITVDGRQWELSAWIKEGQKGKYMSIKAQPPRERAAPSAPPPSTTGNAPEHFDDDIPF